MLGILAWKDTPAAITALVILLFFQFGDCTCASTKSDLIGGYSCHLRDKPRIPLEKLVPIGE